MKAQWKYLVYLDADGDEVACVFGVGTIHAAYAAANAIDPGRIVSAGYATADRECFGVSTSLGKRSQPRADTALLRDGP